MTNYQVGSVADFVISHNPADPGSLENKKVLYDLFSSAGDNQTCTVQNVAIASVKVKKAKKRQNDEFAISSVSNVKREKRDDLQDADEEEISALLDAGSDFSEHDGDGAETEQLSENVSRKLKKIENKNIKKNSQKGKEEIEGNDRVVIIKNLPIKIKRKTISRVFSKFGKVDAVWLRCAALPDAAMPKKVAVIKQDFHPDRKSIAAFVRFLEKESAVKATSFSGTEFKNHHVTVRLVSEDVKQELGKAIFVGNLPFDAEDEGLFLHFQECGSIRDIRIVRDRVTGLGMGFGYVNFDSADSVELAIQLNGSKFCNREIRVERCKNKPKAKNFGNRLDSKKPAGGKNGPSKAVGGAYRRVQEKSRAKVAVAGESSGWMKSMKLRTRAAGNSNGVSKLESFAGETATDGDKAIKPKRAAKVMKKNKDEMKKKTIAAKLTATKEK